MPNKSAQQIAEGLNILRWYIDDNDIGTVGDEGDYDAILVGMGSEELRSIHNDPSNADKIALEKLGWKWNERYDCYAYET
jgi:hypothetical protein